MAHKFKLDDGLETFEIEFEGRNKTTEIAFNPNDSELPKRLLEVGERIDRKLAVANELEKNKLPQNNKKAILNNCIDTIDKMNSIIRSEIDYAFGNKISDKVFKYCSPLDIINGNYFFANFLEAISPFIEETIKTNEAAFEKHIKEYVQND